MRYALLMLVPVAIWIAVVLRSEISISTPVSFYKWTGPFYEPIAEVQR